MYLSVGNIIIAVRAAEAIDHVAEDVVARFQVVFLHHVEQFDAALSLVGFLDCAPVRATRVVALVKRVVLVMHQVQQA